MEPDFDQIARAIGEEAGIARLDEWTSGESDRVRASIVEQLRQVWNARGLADMEQLRAIREDTGTGDTGEILTPRFLAEVISRSDR